MYEVIERYVQELVGVMRSLPLQEIEAAADLLLACYRRGGTIFVLGNGGSAATASHLACDLSKGTLIDGLSPIRVMPLTDNVPLLTAWGNDVGYDVVFARQLSALVRPGDSVVTISVSGASPNVLAAAHVARQQGASTIALTGQDGGNLFRLSDVTVRVPTASMEQAEDVHLAIVHTLCVALRDKLRADAAERNPQSRSPQQAPLHV